MKLKELTDALSAANPSNIPEWCAAVEARENYFSDERIAAIIELQEAAKAVTTGYSYHALLRLSEALEKLDE